MSTYNISGHGYFLDFLFHRAEGGEALGSSGALKPSTHLVMAILYPLGAVKATYALEVEATRALDLVKALKVEVEAVGSSGSCRSRSSRSS
nr:hypothetical protein [Tanacetum cinerariifolium]